MRQDNADHVLQPLNLFNPRAMTSVEQLISQSEAARLQVYSTLGSLQDFALTYAAPAGMSAPARWPCLTQKFRVINRPNGRTLLVSDGLSDPFDDLQSDANVNGYGLEFFVETPSEIKSSWQFQLLFTVCSLAAGHGGIRTIIDDMQLLSTEAEGVSEVVLTEHRQSLVNKAGRVGALLGLVDADDVPERIEGMPLTDVRLVNIKLITLSELKLITELGAEGRQKLAELFQEQEKLVSSLGREPVV